MEDVETFLITVYVAVDDVYQARIAPLRRGQPGRPPAFADSEALTVTLAQQLLGIDSERTWLALLRRNWGALFPQFVDYRAGNLVAGTCSATPPSCAGCGRSWPLP